VAKVELDEGIWSLSSPLRSGAAIAVMIAAKPAQSPAIHAALTVADLLLVRLLPELTFWLICPPGHDWRPQL
jgi:hypothetical protein